MIEYFTSTKDIEPKHLEDFFVGWRIPCVDLMCDADMQSYYERFGMLKSHGMVIRKDIKR